jgi:type I restriction enzyme S subunit
MNTKIMLRDALIQNKEAAGIVPEKTYKQITVRLHHKGVILRGEKFGQELGPKQYMARERQFIISKIDARNGAMGLVPKDLHSAVVTGDFLLYDIVESILYPEFFDYLTAHEEFANKCVAASEGTTNRVRIKPEKFLKIEISLPSMKEQIRIVEKINRLANQMERARLLNIETTVDCNEVMDSVLEKTFSKIAAFEKKPLSILTSKIGSGSTPSGGRKFYPSTGVPFIRSLNVRMRKFQTEGLVFITRDTHEKMKGTAVIPNDVLLNITGASIGRVACLPPDIVEANVNQHVSIVRPTKTLHSRFLMYWLSQPLVQNLIIRKQKGGTREGLTKKQIEDFQIPLPSINDQICIALFLDSIQGKVDQLKELQNQKEKDVADFIPSVLDTVFSQVCSNLRN